MEQRIAEVADWFMNKLHTPIMIKKEETGDIDQIVITVERVSILPGDANRDDYVEEDRIVLHGEGHIDGKGEGGNGTASLPRDSYEIPLNEHFTSALQNEELHLKTERALYRISPQGSASIKH